MYDGAVGCEALGRCLVELPSGDLSDNLFGGEDRLRAWICSRPGGLEIGSGLALLLSVLSCNTLNAAGLKDRKT